MVLEPVGRAFVTGIAVLLPPGAGHAFLGGRTRRDADHNLADVERATFGLNRSAMILEGVKAVGLHFVDCRSSFVSTILVFLVRRGALEHAVRIVRVAAVERLAPPV